MTRVRDREQAAVRAQKALRVSDQLRSALGHPFAMYVSNRRRPNPPITLARTMQGQEGILGVITVVGDTISYPSPPRIYQSDILAEDETAVDRTFERVNLWSGLDIQPEDVTWRALTTPSDDIANPTREQDIGWRNSTRLPESILLDSYTSMHGGSAVVPEREGLAESFAKEVFLITTSGGEPVLPHEMINYGLDRLLETGAELSPDIHSFRLPIFATHGWPTPRDLSIENQQPVTVDERKILLDRLAGTGRKDVADRIQQYLDIVDDEPDEPPVVTESLRSVINFVSQQPKLAPPIVGSDPQGLMELEWHLLDNGDPNSVWGRGNGVVSMKFLGSGKIQYVALSGPYRPGAEREEAQGETTKGEIMASLGMFAHRITAE